MDIGGTATTSEFMKHVLDEIELQTPEIGFTSIVYIRPKKIKFKLLLYYLLFFFKMRNLQEVASNNFRKKIYIFF
jgi:hypothetical protein